MKIRNAVEIYSLDIPVSNLPVSSAPQSTFFSSKKKTHETVYFRSSDDVLLYQNNHPALLNLTHTVQLGIEDPKGSHHFILIELDNNLVGRKTVVFKNSPLHMHAGYYDMYFSKSLKKIIANNVESVIEISTYEKDCKTSTGVEKHTFYDCARDDDDNTFFIYSSGNLIYMVNPGQEINLTDVSELSMRNEANEKSAAFTGNASRVRCQT